MCGQQFLKGNAFGPIIGGDDSAAHEAMSGQQMQHRLILMVSIDAQIARFGLRQTQCQVKQMEAWLQGRDAVNHPIGFFVEPLTLFDDSIGGIFTQNKGEDADDLPLVFNDV